MAERRSRSWITRALRGEAPLAPAIALYAMLVPMAVLAVVAIIGGIGGFGGSEARDALLRVAAVLLSFLAGARFGRLLGGAGSPAGFALTMLPPLVGWAALFLDARPALAVLAVAFAAQGAWDVWSADGIRLPGWYAGLRVRTTPIAVVVLVAPFLALSA